MGIEQANRTTCELRSCAPLWRTQRTIDSLSTHAHHLFVAPPRDSPLGKRSRSKSRDAPRYHSSTQYDYLACLKNLEALFLIIIQQELILLELFFSCVCSTGSWRLSITLRVGALLCHSSQIVNLPEYSTTRSRIPVGDSTSLLISLVSAA